MRVPLLLLLLPCSWALNLLEMVDGPGLQTNLVTVEAVEGGRADLPCDLVPSQPGDSVYLVLWYRQDDKTPIYSYDSRTGSPDLWSEPEVFGDRAVFRDYSGSQPAVLSVSGVSKQEDEGEFTCRVDFRQSPTKYHRVRLSVIVPPQPPVIMDQTGQRVVGSVVGPLNQGETITLDCLVTGGDPLPSVHWYRNDKMIDDSDMKTFDRTVKNRIVLKDIVRSDLNARFRCLAINNNITQPAESFLMIDMFFPPLAVRISSPGGPFAAGKDYYVRCITWGSNPPARLTWTRTNGRKSTNKHLKVINSTSHDNFTESLLLYHPKPAHHHHTIVCTATNHNIRQRNVMEDKVKLEIYFPPTVSLDIGKALNLNDLEEGDDVYFECSISANPPPYKVTWLHNGKEILQKPEMQIFVSNQSLVLQKVTRRQAGNYTCHASNVEGDAESRPVTLTIMYSPVCDERQDVVYGVSENETVRVSCSVRSFPQADTFTWSFNNSLTSTLLPPSSYTSSPGRSLISYTPHSHMDFGTLLCWGTNMVGNQKTNQPCVFHIIPTGPPDAPKWCRLTNHTSDLVSLVCSPGYNGGLAQVIHMEFFNGRKVCVANITGQMNETGEEEYRDEEDREVYFTVSKLPADQQFNIVFYSSNKKGKSQEKYLTASTLPVISGETVITNTDTSAYTEEIPTLVVIFVGATITVLVLVTMLILGNAMKRRMSAKTDLPQEGLQIKNIQNSQSATPSSSWRQNPELHQDKSPDIIKDTKGELSKYNTMAAECGQTGIKPIYSKNLNGYRQAGREEEPPDGGFHSLEERREVTQVEHHNYPLHYGDQHSVRDYQVQSYSTIPRRGGQGVLPLCDNINVARTSVRSSVRTPLLEDDRESCV